MMETAAKPWITAGLALTSASMIAVAPVAPQLSAVHLGQIDSTTAAVELAGVITDWVDAFGASADAIATFATGFPGQLMGVGQDLITAPGQFPSISVDFLNSLVGPSTNLEDMPSLFSSAMGPLVVAMGQTLPAPLGDGGSTDPGLFIQGMAGVNLLLQAVLGPDNVTLGMPGALPSIADWVEGFPGQLLSVGQAALADPTDIPGLMTYLLGSVAAPSPDLIGTPSLFTSLMGPLTVATTQLLPGPLGGLPEWAGGEGPGLFMAGMIGINEVMKEAFSLLPDPVAPAAALGSLADIPGDLFAGLEGFGTNLADLLGGVPLIGDALQWIVDALLGVL